MIKQEYKIVEAHIQKLEIVLNEYGAQGYELVSAFEIPSSIMFRLILKRPVPTGTLAML